MSFKKVTAIAVGIVAIVTALAFFVDLPKYATQSFVKTSALPHLKDYEVLAQNAKDTREMSLENAINFEERRAGDLEIQAFQLEAAGMSSRAVRDQVNLLRKSVSKRERELNKLRNLR